MNLQSTGAQGVTDKAGNALDGEWVNSISTYPSGDGVAGGNFSFGFNVLPGDIARAGIVNVQDVAVIGSSWQKTGFQLADVNGDGVVNGQDLAQVSANWLRTLPAITSVGAQQIASLSVTADESVTDNGSTALAATVANDIANPGTEQADSLGPVAGSIAAPLSTLSATSAQSAIASTAGASATSDDRKSAPLTTSGTLAPADAPKLGDKGRATRAAVIDSVMSLYADFGNDRLDQNARTRRASTTTAVSICTQSCQSAHWSRAVGILSRARDVRSLKGAA